MSKFPFLLPLPKHNLARIVNRNYLVLIQHETVIMTKIPNLLITPDLTNIEWQVVPDNSPLYINYDWFGPLVFDDSPYFINAGIGDLMTMGKIDFDTLMPIIYDTSLARGLVHDQHVYGIQHDIVYNLYVTRAVSQFLGNCILELYQIDNVQQKLVKFDQINLDISYNILLNFRINISPDYAGRRYVTISVLMANIATHISIIEFQNYQNPTVLYKIEHARIMINQLSLPVKNLLLISFDQQQPRLLAALLNHYDFDYYVNINLIDKTYQKLDDELIYQGDDMPYISNDNYGWLDLIRNELVDQHPWPLDQDTFYEHVQLSDYLLLWVRTQSTLYILNRQGTAHAVEMQLARYVKNVYYMGGAFFIFSGGLLNAVLLLSTFRQSLIPIMPLPIQQKLTEVLQGLYYQHLPPEMIDSILASTFSQLQ